MRLIYIFLTLFFTLSPNVSEAQDYFPLAADYEWKYNWIYDRGSYGEIADTFSFKIVEIDTIPSQNVVAYKVAVMDDLQIDSLYYYSPLSDENQVFLVMDFSDIENSLCELPFRHNYQSTLDTLSCDNGELNVSEYYGSYTTILGLTFDDCWVTYEILEDGRGNDYYFVAPNVGLVAFRDKLTDIPDSEIICYSFQSTNIESVNTGSIKVYPNPTSDYLMIDHQDTEAPDRVYIFDLNGLIVEQINYKEDLSINVSHLSSSTYFLIAQKNNRLIWKKQFIKR